MNIEQKRAKAREIQDQIEALRGELIRLKDEIAAEVAPLKVGQTMRWKYGKGFRTGVIIRVRGGLCHQEYTVEPIRKDGTRGSAVTVHAYSKPEAVAA